MTKTYLLFVFALFLSLFFSSFENEVVKKDYDQLSLQSVKQVWTTTLDSNDVINKSCDCGRNGNCSFEYGLKVCKCDDGYAEKDGMCFGCDCGGKFKKCYYTNLLRRRRCECEKGYGVFIKYNLFYRDEETCVECNCGKNASCEFVGNEIYSKKICLCDPGSEEVNGKCEDSICDCGDHGNCSFIKGKKICKCDPGYKLYNGKCEACDCGENGFCTFIYGKTCYCDPGYVEHMGRCSKECDCGNGSESCSVDYMGRKKCSCKDGYVARNKSFLDDEYCEACDCGENEKCEIENGVKRCLCSDGLREYNGKCQECDCGENSVSCTLDYWQSKKCECKEGFYAKRSYTFQDDECLDCDCGTQAESCYFTSYGGKFCRCVYGNVIENVSPRCRECDCGYGAESCIFTLFGKRKCSCKSGYVVMDSDYENGETCVYEFPTNYGRKTTGWKIATYVVSVVIVVIIIGMLIVIADQKVFRSRRSRQVQ